MSNPFEIWRNRARNPARVLIAIAIFVGFAIGASNASAKSKPPLFANPQLVTIEGYAGDAMEPFITRDGSILFFNNSNSAPDTNLYWATKIDDLTFEFQGEIGGANTSFLEGVASMDINGVFYFISTRSYTSTASTIYAGDFSNGAVSNVALVPGVSKETPGWVNFDAEISADGNSLYFVDSYFGIKGFPQDTSFIVAHRRGNAFVRDPMSRKIFAHCNSHTLNYAADTSADELEFFWTRLLKQGPAIFMASRVSTSKPFANPRQIKAITGFAEGPSISPDGHSLYYHHLDGNVFHIYRVTR